jgi:hypothetical protein
MCRELMCNATAIGFPDFLSVADGQALAFPKRHVPSVYKVSLLASANWLRRSAPACSADFRTVHTGGQPFVY